MKPAVCVVCGLASIDEPQDQSGEWIKFLDYSGEDSGLNHPTGLDYFCHAHARLAKKQTHLKLGDAVEILRNDSLYESPKNQLKSNRNKVMDFLTRVFK